VRDRDHQSGAGTVERWHLWGPLTVCILARVVCEIPDETGNTGTYSTNGSVAIRGPWTGFVHCGYSWSSRSIKWRSASTSRTRLCS